ncbi:MAG: AarF/ABC1/UbiB kinase family protein [Desulfobacteraceae bacterium]|nr:AarF/ABC1/UbiB kinase family protein [Desulfobacteraceae bacterium]
MRTGIPENKWQRSIAGGKTAIKVGGKMLKYLAGKPFLDGDGKDAAKLRVKRESADILFQGLSLLKGTALKIAQQLSFESDIFPEEIRKELEKSYHQVPPLNRALIRKVVINELERPPEQLFSTFEPKAFAAASLGQVHRAELPDGRKLAVKIQYPGIDRTIASDIRLIKSILRPAPDYHLYRSALDEIETRLLEEIDYHKEARHITFFKNNLNIRGVEIPDVMGEYSSHNILSETYISGLPLDEWIRTGPSRSQRDEVADRLNTIFFTGLYELNCIHADPNPGNFIIGKDRSVGLVDFGCVKRLDRTFVDRYRQLPGAVVQTDKERYFQLLKELKMIRSDLDAETKQLFYDTMVAFSQWFKKLFVEDIFDFGANPGFFAEGRVHWDNIYRLRKYVDMNPEFVFLDRTRYGLLRIFEKLGARVRLRSRYEWE